MNSINEYYQHQIRNMTYSELRRMAGNSMEIVILWFMKTLRFPVKIPCGFRYPNDLILVDVSALPSHINDRVENELQELREHSSLTTEFFYKIQTAGPVEMFGWSGLFAENSTIGVFNVTRYHEQNKVDEKIEFEFQTVLEDNRILVTSNKRNLLDCPVNFEYKWIKKATLTETLEKHSERFLGAGSKPTALSAANYESKMLMAYQSRMDRLIERKVFVEVPLKKLKVMRA